MTISDTEFKEQYITDGVSKSFPYRYPFGTGTDLIVTGRATDGTETSLSLNGGDFTLDGVADGSGNYTNGATVIFTVAPAAGTLTMDRDTPITMETNLEVKGRLPSEPLEAALDKLTRISQELDGRLSRAFQLSSTATNSGVSLFPVAGEILRFNPSTSALESTDPVNASLVTSLTPTDGSIIVGDGTGWVVESGATARTSLGLTIGSQVQAYDAGLQSISGLTTAADKMVYTTALDVYAVADLTAFGRTLIANASAADARTDLGLGSLATASTINNGDWSGTDLAVTNGGTGASDASGARTNLGLAIGTDVQAHDAFLDTLSTQGNVDLTADVTGELPEANIAIAGTPGAGTFVGWNGSALEYLTPTGSGDVLGPGSNTENTLALWAATSKTLKDGPALGTANQALLSAGAGNPPAFGDILKTNAGDPNSSVTPGFIGQYCYDTTNDMLYIASGTANTDWHLPLQGWVPAMSATASDSGTVEFTGISASVNLVKLVLTNVIPATDQRQLTFRVSDDGGSTWESGASAYTYITTATISQGSSADRYGSGDEMDLTANGGGNSAIGSGNSEGISTTIYMVNPGSSLHKTFYWMGAYENAIGNMTAFTGGGKFEGNTNPIDGIQFYMDNGNIASGEFEMYYLY